MKQLLFLLIMITGACTFTSCDKSDDTVDPKKENLFNSKYIVNHAGCCVLDGLQPIRAEIINDEVKGYGWKVIGIYKIMDNHKKTIAIWCMVADIQTIGLRQTIT